MCGKMNNIEKTRRLENLHRPEYKFVSPNVLLFLTGVPLSGKSTISPLIASAIEGCALQNMDIIRLVAQEIEKTKPESERNPFVNAGSCDSYELIGDGSYSSANLVKGFNAYSEAIVSVLTRLTPRLELQGVRDMLFEGTQLTPSLIAPYLVANNKLIILSTSEDQLTLNRAKLFGDDPQLLERYSIEKLLLLQEEIIRQSKQLPKDKFIVVSNTDDYLKTVKEILKFLLSSGIIK